jgi:SAM-dependent methyltransferase
MELLQTALMSNPVHAENHLLVWLCHHLGDRSTLITPKADGLKCSVDVNGKRVDGEELVFQEKKITLLFDLSHCVEVRSLEEVRTVIEKENEVFQKLVQEGQTVLPKINLRFVGSGEEFLDVLSVNPQTVYGNDGWIIYHPKIKMPLKVKSKHELTVDLLFRDGKLYKYDEPEAGIPDDNLICEVDQKIAEELTNGMIYRCYYDGKWIPRDERPDKKLPNAGWLVSGVERQVKNFVLPNMLKDKLHEFSYYTHKHVVQDDRNINAIFNTKTAFLKEVFSRFRGEPTLLDICCGKGNVINYLPSRRCRRYVGVDSDPVRLSDGKVFHSHIAYQFFWDDCNSFDYSTVTRGQFDLCVMLDCMAYVNLTRILPQVNAKTVVVGYLNTEGLKRWINYKHQLIVDPKGKKTVFTYPWMGKGSFEEPTPSMRKIVSAFSFNGFSLAETLDLKHLLSDRLNPAIHAFLSLYVVLVFHRK